MERTWTRSRKVFVSVIDRFIFSEVFLARLKLALGDVAGAAAILTEAEQSVCQNNFVQRMPEVAAGQVVVWLRQGKLAAAAHLAQMYELPTSQARVHLAQGDPAAALAVLEPWRRQVEAKGWADELLKIMVLQAAVMQAQGEKDKAVQMLGGALALAEPGGFIRLFVDEGNAMQLLISDYRLMIEEQSHNQDHNLIEYVNKLLAAFAQPASLPQSGVAHPNSSIANQKSTIENLVEPLSQRELEVLQLIAQGLSNHEIGERLFLALDTVKGHTRRIYDKLQVQRRTEAVVRARELGLL